MQVAKINDKWENYDALKATDFIYKKNQNESAKSAI